MDGIQASEEKPWGGGGRRSNDRGVREGFERQSLSALESNVVGQLYAAAGPASGHPERRWWNEAAGDSHGFRQNRADGGEAIPGARLGTSVSRGLLRISSRAVRARCAGCGAAEMLSLQLGARSRHQRLLRQHRLGAADA